jgi:hypothetical protein
MWPQVRDPCSGLGLTDFPLPSCSFQTSNQAEAAICELLQTSYPVKVKVTEATKQNTTVQMACLKLALTACMIKGKKDTNTGMTLQET